MFANPRFSSTKSEDLRLAIKPLALACTVALGLGSAAALAQPDLTEEIVVTGSRIQTTGMQTPVRITQVTAEELSAAVPGTMIEGLSEMPQFFDNQTANSNDGWFTRGGYGNLNLRGLGINRTLTLLNGRRMISSTPFGGVDINVFPEAMIQRVDTVTGGASAAYGTDAVAGVVNFILDTNFEGLKLSLNTGATTEGDGDSNEFSIAFGKDIGERGHLIVSGERFKQDGIFSYEGRDWYQAWGVIPVTGGPSVIRPQVVSMGASRDGIIWAPPAADGTTYSLNGMAFDRDGNLVPFVPGDNAFGAIGSPAARHSIANGGSGDDLGGGEAAVLMPENERDSLFLYYEHEIGDNLTVYGQAIRGTNDNWQPVPLAGSLKGTPTAVTIFQDNAFLPDSVRQIMIDEGLASFTLRRVGSSEDLGSQMYFRTENEMTSFTGGFTLDIESDGRFDGWTIDSYIAHGENDRKGYQKGFRVDRIHAAVDAVDDGNGNIVCRTSLPQYSDYFEGCQPLNLFGRGNASAAAIDWVTGNDPGEPITTPLFFADTGYDLGYTDTYNANEAKVNWVDYEQDLFELTATGDIADGWAGAIALAAGVAWRDESVVQIVRDSTNRASDHTNGHPVLCNSDPDAVAAGLRGVSTPDCLNTVGIQYSKVSNIRGDSTVKEAFVETYIPLIADRSAMQRMTLGLSTRSADYSGSGSITAWKGGLDMQFVDSFRVRMTKSRDVRAANMSERFDKTGGIDTRYDPVLDDTYDMTRFSGGNPAVSPEEADTSTAGFVITPSGAPGFQLSYDWYEIKMDGAIGQIGTQAVINRCYEGAQDLCALITRNPDDNKIILVGDVYINIDQNIVRGSDLEIAYRKDVDWFGNGPETVGARIFASWLDENSEILAGTDKTDRAGQTGVQQTDGVAYQLPDFKLTGSFTYTNGPYSVFLQGRYIASGTQENEYVANVATESNHVDSVFYTDLRFGYTHDLQSGTTLEVFANITNLTNEDPPITPYYSVFTASSVQTNSGLFDLLGRRYTAGFRLSF